MKITTLLFTILTIVVSCSLTKNERKITKAKDKLEKESAKLEQLKDEGSDKAEITKIEQAVDEVKKVAKKAKKSGASDEEIAEALNLANKAAETNEEEESDSEIDPKPNSEKEESQVKLKMDSLTVKDLLAVLDTISGKAKPDKFSLDPDTVFYGFSTGTNFEFVDGLDDASLFLDMNANLGQVFHKRLSAEFGVISGRFSPAYGQAEKRFALGGVQVLSDTTYQRTSYSGFVRQDYQSDRKFTRAYGRMNYRLIEHSNTKLFITYELSYNRLEYKNVIASDTLKVTSKISPIENGTRTPVEPSFPNDTLRGKIIQDRSSNLIGLKLFKGGNNFHFTIGTLCGITFIKTIDVNYNDNARTPETSTVLSAIAQKSGFTYVFHGSILEKKVLGAKLGFEIRSIPFQEEDPSYYFYISKQFSMLEFFKIFSPSS